jgi:hypothetical protein
MRTPVKADPTPSTDGATPPAPVTSTPDLVSALLDRLDRLERRLGDLDVTTLGSNDAIAEAVRQASKDVVAALHEHTRAVSAVLDTLQRRFTTTT